MRIHIGEFVFFSLFSFQPVYRSKPLLRRRLRRRSAPQVPLPAPEAPASAALLCALADAASASAPAKRATGRGVCQNFIWGARCKGALLKLVARARCAEAIKAQAIILPFPNSNSDWHAQLFTPTAE